MQMHCAAENPLDYLRSVLAFNIYFEINVYTEYFVMHTTHQPQQSKKGLRLHLRDIGGF